MCLSRLRDRAAQRQRNLCYYCGCQLSPPGLNLDRSATAEHLKARQDGGRDTAANIVAACRRCNLERHALYDGMPPDEYRLLVLERANQRGAHPGGSAAQQRLVAPRRW